MYPCILAIKLLAGKEHGLLGKIKRQKCLLLMLLPAFIVLLLFYYVPLSGWYMAFSEYELGGSIFGGEFVGFKYFSKIFNESKDLQYLVRNTLAMNGGTIIVNISVAFIFAILLNEIRWKPVANAVQTVSFFPYFVSWVIAYALISALFSVKTGAINQFLVNLGVLKKGFNFLGDEKYSWGLIIVLNMWKFTGYNTIIFLSALSGIPTEQYEAASLDGASRFQKILYITVPHLLPTAAVLTIMNTGWIFSSNLEEYFIFQNATNWQTMEVLDMYIYKFGLKLLDFPYATAMSIIKTAVSVILLFAINKISKKLGNTSVL